MGSNEYNVQKEGVVMGGGGGVQISQGERDLADLAEQRWLDYQHDGVPMERKYAARTLAANKIDSRRLGIAGATAGQIIDKGQNQANQGMILRGINPSSGAFISNNSGSERAAGVGSALAAQNSSNTAGYLAGLDRAVKVGHGLSVSGQQGISHAAGLQLASNIGRAQAAQIESQGIGQAIGAGIGTFIGAGGPSAFRAGGSAAAASGGSAAAASGGSAAAGVPQTPAQLYKPYMGPSAPYYGIT